jgi:hypothetical protein
MPPLAQEYRGKRPPDPSLPADEKWTVTSVCRRVVTREGTQTCPATGEAVSLTQQHLYVTAVHDSAPEARSPSKEFTSYVLRDERALRRWFDGDSAV